LKEAEKSPANFLTGEKAFDYFYDAILCKCYAQLNRRVILRNILRVLNLEYDEGQIIETIHNYIDFEDFIIRKGAIAARKDQLCIVSLNMKEGILLCKGKGNEDWNYSCAHGLGRTSSRAEAVKRLTMSQFEADMSGVYSSSVVRETLDEAPRAYKDSKMVIQLIEQSVEIIDQLRPILNIKATS
jgi:tRNA-splicing ligase RtcB